MSLNSGNKLRYCHLINSLKRVTIIRRYFCLMNRAIADIRKDYTAETLVEKDVDKNPIVQFKKWWEAAIAAEIEEPNAMTLATASSDGIPSARIVLLKDLNDDGFIFYSNYKSYKGLQLAENPKACLVFFWKELERQVRITGLVTKQNEKESSEYFHTRPVLSQISAAVSPQSQVIPGREWIEEKFESKKEESATNGVLKPSHWGGYMVKPVVIEFWQGRRSRLHDRIQYTLEESGSWKIERLAP